MFYTYILASRRNGTLYTGSTDNLSRRIFEHREKLRPGFTKTYGVQLLVWYEAHEPERARKSKSAASRSGGAWKLRLIEERNPDWRDLYEDIGLIVEYR